MNPTKYDHDDALNACWKVKEKGKEKELSNELITLNQVAGAWACNDNCLCSNVTYDQFKQALDKANNA